MQLIQVRSAAGTETAEPLELPEDPAAVRLAAGALGRRLSSDAADAVDAGEADAGPAALDARDVTGPRLAALVEGLVLGGYRFSQTTGPQPAVREVLLCGADGSADDIAAGLRAATATGWARDLANTRSNVKSPQWLAEQAAGTLGEVGVEVLIRDETWLAEQGFGGVLAVGAGSANPPRLIEARWRPPGSRGGPHPVLVGKGITFDTGGINRKVGPGMISMFTDMAGGAAVLGAVQAVAAARLPIQVTALVPAAENSFAGGAYRPSDVIRHHGGRTSEITNTDAEGRIVLADAISYAAARLRATAIVDIATLTGAMKVALGLRTGGLFATDDALAGGLLAAGAATGEPLWRLPLQADYEPLLASSVADAINAPGNPGGITAALFLRPFAGDVPWAHLDVAGPARASREDGMFELGATGFGTRLLAAWVDSLR